VTVKKCGCNFSVKIKVLNFKIKIQWTLKKNSVMNLKSFFKFIKSRFLIYADGEILHDQISTLIATESIPIVDPIGIWY